MRLFDTLSRDLRELKPVDGDTFRFYCCGPTVYGPAHIGNFRTFVLQDVLRRVLETDGLKTCHVRNITDVDDKTIRDSVKAGETLTAFTAKWRDLFHADCEALNCCEPHIEPSAVEHIPQQIVMIEELVEKGHAYASEDGSVYFNIGSFPGYGKLSRLDTRELELGKTQATSANNSDEYEKGSAADFVLWKARRPEDGENYWQSPWGEGRPGWHLECSAMIREYFGETFDLHSGGVDLVFPHHENEIAQSQCSCGGEFARHWFHTTHLTVDGEKMAKSKGNLYTLEMLAEKGWSAMEVRYVLICAHYRKPLNFTFESLHSAREAIQKIANARKILAAKASDQGAGWGGYEPAWEKLSSDLNTPGALGAVFKRIKKVKGLSAEEAADDLAGLDRMMDALGLSIPVLEDEAIDVPRDIEELAQKRWEAKLAKDWAASDAFRDEVLAKGWVIKDAPNSYSIEKR